MRRAIAIVGLVLAASAAAVADAQSTPTTQQAAAHGLVCQTALDPAARAVSITAEMRPVAGTMKMQMRFELLKRVHRHGRSVSVTGKGLKSWTAPPDPTLGQRSGDHWVVHHPVVDLAAPGFYRFRVSFRWLGQSGKVLASVSHRTRTCFQPELRPDLAVAKVVPIPGNRYAAVIVNRGKTASGPFEISVTLGSSPPQSDHESSLQPQTRLQIPFACAAAEPVTVVADPAGAVDDFDRSNNTLSETCPGATTSGALRRRR